MSSSPPPTMKAAIRTGWTGYTAAFVEDCPTPKLSGKDKVLIKVHAAALNPADYKLPKLIFGAVYGLDLCGTVVQATADCTSCKVGDVVVGPVAIGYSGALAEYAVCYGSKMALLPKHWTPEEGAALPIACGTAMDGFDKAGILEKYRENPDKPPIETLLVIGASGGCGLLALQLAKGMGIPRIIGICSAQNKELCLKNGASEVVPYDQPMDSFLQDNIGKIDVIYDAASYSGGGEAYCDNLQVLALLNGKHPNSYIILNGSLTSKVKAVTLGMVVSLRRTLIVVPTFSASGLQLGMELLDKAQLKPILDTSHAFTKEGVQEAYQKLKSRRAKGKIVVTISPDNNK